MSPDEVSAIVEREIGGQWSRSNLHGVVLKECLVSPHKLSCLDALEHPLEAWIVLHECPPAGPGYAVVFEEHSKMFGLAQFAEGYKPCVFGLYGSFFNALEAM